MVIPEESVQDYINNPSEVSDMLHEEWKDGIRDDMSSKSDDLIAKQGMGCDYFWYSKLNVTDSRRENV